MENLFKKVLNAKVYDLALRTPLDLAENISRNTKNNVWLKREDLQPVFSFKIRGAYNKIAHLTKAEQEVGVISASAGNHAQGVALSAKHLGIPCTIVMPKTTPAIKVNAVKNHGAEVVLVGDNYSEAAVVAEELMNETGKTYIHPFDDELVIAGQGTLGHEILQQCAEVDYIFVPVGGGGLIAGIAAYVKSLRPEVKIIGVEPEDSDAMTRSVKEKQRVVLKEVGIFADGVAVTQVGELTFKLVEKYVDEMITVSTDQICSSIKSIYEDIRSITEPAGALAVAGLKKYLALHNLEGKNVVALNSGANMNFDRLQFVAERTLTGEKREALFCVSIPEKPGSLKLFCEQIVGEKGITEFNYRLAERSGAHIFVGISILNESEREKFKNDTLKAGFGCEDLTDNDLAKTHIRHMVGGKSFHQNGEVVYRFHFPERPKALTDFLSAMSESWNISMFHYRMHGGDFGRVLVGFEIPEGDNEKFKSFLENLHYPYAEETDNPAYKLFL